MVELRRNLENIQKDFSSGSCNHIEKKARITRPSIGLLRNRHVELVLFHFLIKLFDGKSMLIIYK